MMVRVTYEPRCHADFNSMRPFHWGLLNKAGWDVEYDNPLNNGMCGSRATKAFNTLSEAIFEFSDITRIDLFRKARYYADKTGKQAGQRMTRCTYHQARPFHYFLVKRGNAKAKEYDGREVLSVIKSRFSK